MRKGTVRKQHLFSALEGDGDIQARLAAARELSELADSQDLPRLRQLLSIERVGWIKSSLASTIEHFSGEASEPIELDDDLITSEGGTVTERIARIFVHELRRSIGVLDLYASQDIRNYDQSQTAGQMQRLRELLGALKELANSAAEPKHESFDLAAVLNDIVSEQTAHEAVEERAQRVRIANSEPQPVRSDRGKVGFIVRNALQNAIEATSSDAYEDTQIVISCGATDRDIWIAVRDFGPGLDDTPSALLRPGTSHKKGHFGIGLAIADLAARSMGGKISLRRADGGGVQFEARWPL